MENISNKNIEKLIDAIKSLDERIERIEKHIKYESESSVAELDTVFDKERSAEEKEDALEYAIGGGWFAKMGIVVLSFGILFLLSTPYENAVSYLPSLIGLVIAGVILGGSVAAKNLYPQISGYLLGGSIILLYFSVMRFYFFGAEATITSLPVIVALLLVVSAIHLFVALKRNSIHFAYWSLLLGYTTALISDSAYFIFALIILISSVAVYLRLKREWINMIFFGIFFSYLTHFMWFINNPFLGKPIEAVSLPLNLLFILCYAVIFALGNILRKNDKEENYFVTAASFLNAGSAYALLLLTTYLSPFEYSGIYHLLGAIVFMALAVTFWVKEQSKLSTFVYAMTAYVALSFAIINLFAGSDIFILLCWQSLLVVSTAVWFRSKLIIVSNFVIYVGVFIAYLIAVQTVSLVSISFGIVALLSARILNWKKEELELQTEQMRNAYLIVALLVIPYALYHSLPVNYVSYAWVAVALIYYWLSNILKNKKYRWMSLATLLMTVVYVLIFGITTEETTDRILAFLVLGVILLLMSLIYTKKKTKESEVKLG
ncbi:MAG: DUF2339 domain-containing protein [Bacteroidetes bacterium]|nr:DUF2339 domain-containing protein [Bacteroidota bacterium]